MDPECETAFQQLKHALSSAPILVAPCDDGQYVLDTDVSDAVLQQKQNSKLHVVGYASRALSPAEARYCITHRELLGVVFGLKKYRQHLLGRPIIVRNAKDQDRRSVGSKESGNRRTERQLHYIPC